MSGKYLALKFLLLGHCSLMNRLVDEIEIAFTGRHSPVTIPYARNRGKIPEQNTAQLERAEAAADERPLARDALQYFGDGGGRRCVCGSLRGHGSGRHRSAQ